MTADKSRASSEESDDHVPFYQRKKKAVLDVYMVHLSVTEEGTPDLTWKLDQPFFLSASCHCSISILPLRRSREPIPGRFFFNQGLTGEDLELFRRASSSSRAGTQSQALRGRHLDLLGIAA